MPITLVSTTVTEVAPTGADQFVRTGVMHQDQYKFCDASDVLKQIGFDASALSTNVTATYKPATGSTGTISVPTTIRGLPNTLAYNVPLTADTYTVAAGVDNVVFKPAGTIAALTVVYPTTPANGTTLAIMSTQIVTALTNTGGGSDTVSGALSALAVNTPFKMIYRTADTTWYRTL